MRRPIENGGTRPSHDNPPYRKVLPFAWLLFSAVWLFYSAGFVTTVLETSPSTAETVLFLASLMVFAAPFVWLMVRYSCPDTGLALRELRTRFVFLTVLLALALYVEIVYGFGIPWRFMYPVVAAAVTLPTRYAVWATLSISAFAVSFYGVRSGWEEVAANWTNLITFVTSGGGMIVVSRLVVMVRELYEARQEIARLAVSEERLRFARDLHDLLGHSLSSITLKSELAGRLLADARERPRAAKEVRDIQAIARGALREVREAVSGYRQPTLGEELVGAREILEAAGIECRIEDGVGPLPKPVEAVLAWTVREGVTNVIRHSHASRCEIRLARKEATVYAEVVDDGWGLSPAGSINDGSAGGSGLSGLAERVATFDGAAFEAGPRPEGGFGMRVVLPLDDSLPQEVEMPSPSETSVRLAGKDGMQ